MAKLIKASGEIQEVYPKNGKYFTLEEVQDSVQGYVEAISCPSERYPFMLVNEDGVLDHLPLNEEASDMLTMMVVGDVMLFTEEEYNKWDNE